MFIHLISKGLLSRHSARQGIYKDMKIISHCLYPQEKFRSVDHNNPVAWMICDVLERSQRCGSWIYLSSRNPQVHVGIHVHISLGCPTYIWVTRRLSYLHARWRYLGNLMKMRFPSPQFLMMLVWSRACETTLIFINKLFQVVLLKVVLRLHFE